MTRVALSVLVLSVWSCTSDPEESTEAACDPGSAQRCVGPDSCRGEMYCLEDGTGYGPCDCPATAADAGADGMTQGDSAAGGCVDEVCSCPVGQECLLDCTTPPRACEATCEPGSRCDYLCTGSACTGTCNGAACELTCTAGCSLDCLNAANCRGTCSAGGCELTCQDTSSCSFSQCQGGCTLSCGTGGQCIFANCVNGGCQITCGPDSTCRIESCEGGGCTIQCDPTANCYIDSCSGGSCECVGC